MGIGERLSEEVDSLGLRWGVPGVRERAEEVVKALAARAAKEPLVALSLVQALCADPASAGYFERPSTRLVRETIRKSSELLGEGDLPRWVRLVAQVALEHVTGDAELLWKFAHDSKALWPHWGWAAPRFELEADTTWEDVRKVIEVVPEPAKTALSTLHGRVGALDDAIVAFTTAWSPPTHLLWWAQSEWSEPFRKPWSDLPEDSLAPLLVFEFARVAPAADAAVNFLLKTLRDQGVTLGEARPMRAWIARAQEARAWGRQRGYDGLGQPPANLSEQLGAEPTALPIYAGLVGHAPAAEPDVSARVFYRRLAEELLVVRHVFGS